MLILLAAKLQFQLKVKMLMKLGILVAITDQTQLRANH